MGHIFDLNISQDPNINIFFVQIKFLAFSWESTKNVPEYQISVHFGLGPLLSGHHHLTTNLTKVLDD